MSLPIFYYANGTNFLFNSGGITIPMPDQGDPVGVNIKGLGGQIIYWDGWIPNDPFPLLLSPELWQYKRVPYPAQALFGGPSIEQGVDWVINDIKSRDPGTLFALGGYSQGAAVMSRVYNECRQGRLSDRRVDLRAMVTFGNPMRETNHTYPGSSGYSGAADLAGSTRNGHGIFPALEDIPFNNVFGAERYVARFARLRNTEDLVWDFTYPAEAVSGIGDTDVGKFMQFVSGQGLTLVPILGAALAIGLADAANKLVAQVIPGALQDAVTKVTKVVDALTGQVQIRGGGGHIMYPFYPPPNSDGSIPSSGDTSYQIAARYLNAVGTRIYNEQHPNVVAPVTEVAQRPVFSWYTSLPNG